MKTKKTQIALIGFLLTFTGLVGATSTAFSQNLKELAVGEMKNITIASNPEPLKDFSFVNENGETLNLSEFKGKTILLNFWATWCAPCKKEMPSIDRLQGELGSDEFEVVAISHDIQGIERVKKFLKALKIKNLAPYNDKTLKSGRAAGVFGLPATLIINKEGLEVARLVGPAEWDSEEAVKLIRQIMAQ
ncbi:TlpA family protein disulfide reductase [Sneathiella glossodoripedis]|uniref:TlpA family protein disulfide reductase n=1 Tax=Sneathiella glossodoripedis TaxID=418853 RepID=UPI00046F721A|nr:TlpA disulfide reductase family protein [Sneathiella glossodoripedis]